MKRVAANQQVDERNGLVANPVYQLVTAAPTTSPTLVDRILWLEPFWIVILTPSLLLRDLFWEPWLHPWLIGALFLFWPLRLWRKGRLAPATPINLPLLLLLLWSPVGLWMSVSWERSWHALGMLALGGALYFALLNWPPAQRRPWLVALAIALVGLLLAVIGPAILPSLPTKLFTFEAELAQSKPADLFGTGETINSNVLAGALLLPIPLLVALGIRRGWARQRWLPPLLLAPALYIGWALLLSQSRGSYLALIIALLVVFTLRWPWSGVAFIVAGVATVASSLVNGNVLLLDAIGSDGSVTSFSGRVEIWAKSLLALGDFWPTGIGIGTFNLVIPLLYPYEAGWGNQIEHAHNLLLQVGVDLGVPGLLLYGWLLVAVFGVLIKTIRHGGVGEETAELPIAAQPATRRDYYAQRRHAHRQAALRWALAVGVLAAMVAMLVHGLVDAVTWSTKLAFLPWLFYALAALLWQQDRRTGANPPTTQV